MCSNKQYTASIQGTVISATQENTRLPLKIFLLFLMQYRSYEDLKYYSCK